MEKLQNVFKEAKIRLDLHLVSSQLCSSRQKAKELIDRGAVTVNGVVCLKASHPIKETDEVGVASVADDHYVSRAALKLKGALDHFQINPQGLEILDVGISTGGFAQVLLERGAKKIVGIDVGKDQLHESLRSDSRVQLWEGVNAKEPLPFADQFPLIVIDVSFISLLKVLPSCMKALAASGKILALVKPQFEQHNKVKKLVLSEAESKEIVNLVRQEIMNRGLNCSQVYTTPIKGKEGNQEYFLLCAH